MSEQDVIYVAPEPDPIRQALIRLAGDPELRSRLSTRALTAAARHFGLDAFVRAYESVYEEARALRSGRS
jgi:glycosyltransferase involved in cell wall biosynthesis